MHNLQISIISLIWVFPLVYAITFCAHTDNVQSSSSSYLPFFVLSPASWYLFIKYVYMGLLSVHRPELCTVHVVLGFQWQLGPEFLSLSNAIVKHDFMWLHCLATASPSVIAAIITCMAHWGVMWCGMGRSGNLMQAGQQVRNGGGGKLKVESCHRHVARGHGWMP